MNIQQVKGSLTGNPGRLPNPENKAVCRRAAAEGMVLLENDGTLPLRPGRVALYGGGARGTVYCGTGSGYVFTEHAVTVEEGLKNSGFGIVSTSWLERWSKAEKEANKKDKTLSMLDRKWSGLSIFCEEPEVTAEDLDAAKVGVAVYVLRRSAGEGGDRKPEKGDYYFSDRERENLSKIAAFYRHTVVVLNTCVIDLSFVREIPGISAVVYMGLAGMEGGNALADILTGRVNPCGCLTDTLAKRYEDYPASASFADRNSDGMHPVYAEDIFVGYRHFDSFGIEPLYPFGYGGSYTTFSLRAVDAAADWNAVTLTVEVTNTGRRAGRRVVQLYVSAPAGKLTKPFQELKAYAKTGVLAPGASETVTLSFPTEALSSFDEARSAWVMEPGDYLLRLGSHSRDTEIAATVTLDAEAVTRTVTDLLPPDTELTPPVPTVVCTDAPAGFRLSLAAADCVTVDNVSKIPDTVTTYVPEGETYLPRANDNPYKPPFFSEETVETVRACPDATLLDVADGKVTLEEFVASLPDEVLARIVTGTLEETPFPVPSRTGKKLKKASLPQSSGSTTAQYEESLGIPAALLFDGPAGAHIVGCAATAFPVGVCAAQTWDVKLLEELGRGYAKDMQSLHITVALGPGMNIHRDPLCGRCFEYYSEDPILTGRTAAAFTKGMQADERHGVSIKHFAANNQETHRLDGNSTISRRALREIYLRSFELVVREAKPMTIMTSYNLLNGRHTSERRDLVTQLVRGEWGFEGFFMTDWGTESDKAFDLLAGNDLIMGGYRAEKLLDAMRGTEPAFGADGAVSETVKTSHMGMVKTVLNQWGCFVPEAGGPDSVTTTVEPGVLLGDAVLKGLADGTVKVTENREGRKTVTWHGVRRGAYLPRGAVQACAMRILRTLLDSAAMEELESRLL